MLYKNHFYYQHLIKSTRFRHIYNLGSGLFVWLFLLITLPFGIYQNNLPDFLSLAYYLSIFGIGWILVHYVADFFYYKFIEDNTRNSFILTGTKIVIQVHTILIIRLYYCENFNCIDLIEYLQIWMAALIITILFYVPFVMFAKYQYFHKLVGAEEKDSSEIEIKGTSRERLRIKPENILYIESDDNYVQIFHLDSKNIIQKALIRQTLKKIERQLSEFNYLVRIHRSALVNLRYVNKSDSSLHILKLDIIESKKEFPVSNSYRKILSELIEFNQ